MILDESKNKYLKLLSDKYKNINMVSSEIISLKALLNMPKGTEHFLSDIHGEYDAFIHILRNSSGVIKSYIEDLFGNTLKVEEKRELASLIYYPKLKIRKIKEEKSKYEMNEWYKSKIYKIVRVCKRVSAKYTRSKVRSAISKEFEFIIEELIYEDMDKKYKADYYTKIIDTIVETEQMESFIVAISDTIYRLSIDHLHIIGDIYDRGKYSHKIMDELMCNKNLDIQWGNHDIAWMGASLGSEALICNVIRIAAKYNNLHTIEEGYGINLMPLAIFAVDTYKNDSCEQFKIDEKLIGSTTKEELSAITKMHKAISVIQFKLEGTLIKRRQEFEMNDRILLEKLNKDKTECVIGGKSYNLLDTNLPTVSYENPLQLTESEKNILKNLKKYFMESEKLKKHVKLLFSKGSMYLKYNDNLLLHGCIPVDENMNYKVLNLFGKYLSGKDLLEEIEKNIRIGYLATKNSKEQNLAKDLMWYLWCGKNSPLFGKNKMSTFERYFIGDEELIKEERNSYYFLRDNEKFCNKILEDFGIDKNKGKIINGHVPVKVIKGEKPIKANGKLITIDGGFSKAYQPITGIAGYTLIYHSLGMVLVAHEPFSSKEQAISGVDVISSRELIMESEKRIKVADTDIGMSLKEEIKDLEMLLVAYKSGYIKENV